MLIENILGKRVQARIRTDFPCLMPLIGIVSGQFLVLISVDHPVALTGLAAGMTVLCFIRKARLPAACMVPGAISAWLSLPPITVLPAGDESLGIREKEVLTD